MALPSVTLGGGIMDFNMGQQQQVQTTTGALPSVTMGGNTMGMNPGIQAGQLGGSVMMPQTYMQQPQTTYMQQPATTYMEQPQVQYMQQPAQTVQYVQQPAETTYMQQPVQYVQETQPQYTTSYVTQEAAPTYTTMTQAAPITTYAAPEQVTYNPGSYVTQAPVQQYAAPVQQPSYATLPTTSSMIAYPQQTYQTQQFAPQQLPMATMPAQQFVPMPAAPVSAPPSPEKRDVKVAKKKKTGTCGMCCAPSKKPAAKDKKKSPGDGGLSGLRGGLQK